MSSSCRPGAAVDRIALAVSLITIVIVVPNIPSPVKLAFASVILGETILLGRWQPALRCRAFSVLLIGLNLVLFGFLVGALDDGLFPLLAAGPWLHALRDLAELRLGSTVGLGLVLLGFHGLLAAHLAAGERTSRAAEAGPDQAATLRNLLRDSGSIGYMETDRQGHVTFINPMALYLTGRLLVDVIARDPATAFGDGELARALSRLLVGGGAKPRVDEVDHRTPDGTPCRLRLLRGQDAAGGFYWVFECLPREGRPAGAPGSLPPDPSHTLAFSYHLQSLCE